jgi:restriction system protein
MLPAIERSAPSDWRDLQLKVRRILTECGMEADVEREIVTARSVVRVDVFAEDKDPTPPAIVLCECKHWRKAVSKGEVHAFRTVVQDSGANLGMIISSAGFQSGAKEAAQYTNLRLLTWRDFQDLFAFRWFKRYMVPLLWREVDILTDYTEPFNAAVHRRVESLAPDARLRFAALQNKWGYVALWFAPLWRFNLQMGKEDIPSVPIQTKTQIYIPAEVTSATSLRELFDALVAAYRTGMREFKEVLGD